jgi:hypothetical protein
VASAALRCRAAALVLAMTFLLIGLPNGFVEEATRTELDWS